MGISLFVTMFLLTQEFVVLLYCILVSSFHRKPNSNAFHDIVTSVCFQFLYTVAKDWAYQDRILNSSLKKIKFSLNSSTKHTRFIS